MAREFAIEGVYPRRSRLRTIFPLNNNRSNRRRGRGNNRSQGGNQLNRIDSRARGNAPQLLEKYKKLAHDASLNGDRVQAEYYLQFADHYFRVIADGRARQDEQRARRDDDRFQPGDSQSEEDEEDNGYDNAPPRGGRGRGEGRNSDAGTRRAEPSSDGEDGADQPDDDSAYEPPENPFVRRAPRARSTGRRKPAEQEPGAESSEGLDPTSLPPSIGARESEDEKPAPRKRARRPRATKADDGGEPLEKTG